MLTNLIASSAEWDIILRWIEYAALAIEILAVAIIVVAIFYSMARYFLNAVIRPERRLEDRYRRLNERWQWQPMATMD